MRYDHLNFRGLKILAQKEMVKGLPLIHTLGNLCEGCILEKCHRDSFPFAKSRRVMKSSELVHTDICGLFEVESFGKKRYFLLFVDDFSRKKLGLFSIEKI